MTCWPHDSWVLEPWEGSGEEPQERGRWYPRGQPLRPSRGKAGCKTPGASLLQGSGPNPEIVKRRDRALKKGDIRKKKKALMLQDWGIGEIGPGPRVQTQWGALFWQIMDHIDDYGSPKQALQVQEANSSPQGVPWLLKAAPSGPLLCLKVLLSWLPQVSVVRNSQKSTQGSLSFVRQSQVVAVSSYTILPPPSVVPLSSAWGKQQREDRRMLFQREKRRKFLRHLVWAQERPRASVVLHLQTVLIQPSCRRLELAVGLGTEKRCDLGFFL